MTAECKLQNCASTPFQESDLAFAERLMHEEGLFYFFEHSGDADSPSLGSHTMVIADHNGAFQPNSQSTVLFTQPGAVMKVDSIDRWRSETRWATNAIEMSSWDYRAVNHRPVSATGSGDVPTLTSRDTPGAYAYQTREHGQRIADNQLQALEAARQMHVAAGTVRTLSPGTTFTLHGQAQFDLAPNDDARTFVVVRAVHLMHNNLSADLLGGVIKLLGQGAVAAAGDKEFKLHAIVGAKDIALHAVGTRMGQRAIDMTISGFKGKTVLDANGKSVEIDGKNALHALGRTFGVIKLITDAPHWSDDGH
jgi:type VI secretion system secreted protein VgrG